MPGIPGQTEAAKGTKKPKRPPPKFRRPEMGAIEPKFILEAGLRIQKDDARALYFLAYLLGARIDELTKLNVSRFKIYPDRVVVDEVPTEKHKDKFETRTVIIPLGENALCLENEMWAQVQNYIAKFEQFSTPFCRWKNMSEYLARNCESITAEARVFDMVKMTVKNKIVTKRFNPHFFRHCRASHLGTFYGFTEAPGCKFFGWKDPRMWVRYGQANILEDAFKMKKRGELPKLDLTPYIGRKMKIAPPEAKS